MKRLIQLLLSVGFYAIRRLWLWSYRLRGKNIPGTRVVLYYHAIPANERTRFAQQMDMLVRLAQPVAADSSAAIPAGTHSVAVTFDDGFRSVIANALPELAKRQIPTTLFIPSGYLGQTPHWLREEPHPDASETIATIEEFREVVSDLVTLGSHTVSHANLLTLNQEEARKELRRSREDLSALLATDVRLLSFPYGAYDHQVVEVSRQTGYTRVFSTLPTLVEPTAYVVGRVGVQTSDWPVEFFLKLQGAYQWLPYAFTLKRKLRLLVSGRIAAPGLRA